MTGMPLLFGSMACLVGGLLTDAFIRRTGDRKWGRRLFGMIGYGGAGTCYLAAAGVKLYDPSNLFLFAIAIEIAQPAYDLGAVLGGSVDHL